MEKIKLLLYCTKQPPYLIRFGNCYGYNQFDTSFCKEEHISAYEYGQEILNGKIVAECDFEVEHLYNAYSPYRENDIHYFDTDTLNEAELIKKSCLSNLELENYFKNKNGYAIHIKNLNIFDKPRELSEYSKRIGDDFQVLGNAPKNMMKCCEIKYFIKDYILISIRPEWLVKILNGEQTILVKKKVLKEML